MKWRSDGSLALLLALPLSLASGVGTGCAKSQNPQATAQPVVVVPPVDAAAEVDLNCSSLVNALSGDYDQFKLWDGKQRRDGIISFERKGTSGAFALSIAHSRHDEFFEADVVEYRGSCAIEWRRPSDLAPHGYNRETNRLIEIRPNGDLILGGDSEEEASRPVLKLGRRR